ncbi:N-methyl-L-tryptophan oxidase [Labedella populi]|uniref:N-methyl-L-tryptophan oxidase n=1 Tax=Labedella populi TaxID=2498850 RepID=UPI00140B3773|nr:N-methyl-L-tryptophan oxidase [Labedella populi]
MIEKTVDVAVVGVGAAGSHALLSAARRGASVLGIEQFPIGHDRGSSHGRSRLFRGGASEGPLYVDLARRSREIWAGLEQETGREILSLVSGVTIGPADGDLIRDTRSALEARDMPFEVLDPEQLRHRFPQHRVLDGDRGLLDPATGVVRPELAITTAVELARAAGATVWDGTRVLSIDDTVDGVTIETDRGTVVAKKLILSAGAWAARLLPDLPTPFVVRRAILTWFTPRDGSADDFTPERFPVFTRDDGDLRGWGAPMIDEFGVKVGLHDQDGPVVGDPSRNPAEVTAAETARVEEFVSRQFDGLVPTAVHAKGCMITLTPDENFSVGTLREHPDVVLLAACSGHGFKHSPAIGEIGADLAILGRTTTDISPLDPHRFTRQHTTTRSAT